MTTIKDLKFDDKNFNKHTEFGMSLLEKSLRQNGAGRSILLDKDNNIIAGNGIVEAAGSVGLEKVKIVEANGDEIIAVKRTDISLDSEAGREMALADNATAAADLEWDEEALRSEFDDSELKGWGIDIKPYKEIEEDEPAPVDNENTYSIVGDIYQLGEHRIFCGSFEDDEKVRELFGNKKATCTFTDPPYNVAVKNRTTGKTIQNDNMDRADFQDFLNRAFEVVASNMATGGGVISWMSDVEILTLKNAMDNAGLKFKTMLCWVKDHFTLGGGDFQSAKELAIYGIGEGKFERDELSDETSDSQYGCYARGKDGAFTDSRKLSNVWFFDKPKASKDHPTMKPIGLCAKGILAMSAPDDIVFDPFSGSGSTLIACEQTGRKCYGCEIDPKYCDVIRKRYWKFKTGSEEGWQDGTKAIATAK